MREHRGWYVATTTLDFERSGISRVVSGVRLLGELTELASRPGPDGRRPADDSRVRHKLAELHMEFTAGRLLAYRVAWMQSQGLVPNHEASMSKLYGTFVNQRLAGMINMLGLHGQLWGDGERAPLGGRDAGRVPERGAADDRGGNERDPAEHHRHAGLGPPAGVRILTVVTRPLGLDSLFHPLRHVGQPDFVESAEREVGHWPRDALLRRWRLDRQGQWRCGTPLRRHLPPTFRRTTVASSSTPLTMASSGNVSGSA